MPLLSLGCMWCLIFWCTFSSASEEQNPSGAEDSETGEKSVHKEWKSLSYEGSKKSSQQLAKGLFL